MARVSTYPLGTLPGTVYAIIGGNPRRVILGAMAAQASNAVSITGGNISGVGINGGSINGAPIGQGTPAAGTFTTARANALGVGEAAGAEPIRAYRTSDTLGDAVAQLTARVNTVGQRDGLTLLYSRNAPMALLNGLRIGFDAESSNFSRYRMAEVQAITNGTQQNQIRLVVYNGLTPVTFGIDRFGSVDMSTGATLRLGGVQLLQARRTGWGVPSGTATRTTFTTGTVTLAQLAERVKALIDDLTAHGMIGA
ncbi:hypothetical protein [Microcystis phage MACPNOA1]|nr:hypothetical protein [Microcystis phage MACPNOA1]